METAEQASDGQQAKRRRRTGWDAPAAPAAPAAVAAPTAPPLDAVAAQRLAIERAQALVAQQALAQSIVQAGNLTIPISSNPLAVAAPITPQLPVVNAISSIPSVPVMQALPIQLSLPGMQMPSTMGASRLDCRIYIGCEIF